MLSFKYSYFTHTNFKHLNQIGFRLDRNVVSEVLEIASGKVFTIRMHFRYCRN